MAAYNFPNSPSDGDTVTSNGITYTYSSSKTRWDGAAPSGSSTTVYATIDLLPLSGASTGDQAYVSGNNRLYIWNGTGWYNIALINTTPSISGANASYNLAIDGTATTVTITATDPEGLPITYSIASDTSGNIATVTQGTGANTNVFTITPSTNTANAGTFSLTFRASDGVNIATAISSFTLQFQILNSNYTTALITSVGANNAVNNSFDDASTNNHTITATGNVAQNTFSPYRHGGYSAFLDGAGDTLTVPSTSTVAFGTGAFTVEAWVYISSTGDRGIFQTGGSHFPTSASNSVALQITASGTKWAIYANNTSTQSSITYSLNKWYHVAVVRSASTTKLYVDGVEAISVSDSTNYSGTYLGIGAIYGAANAQCFNGYISDFRVVKGTAVYTSAFTPPTDRLTAVTNTELLTCHLPYIADGSTNSHTITVNGDVKTEPLGPYDYTVYSASSNGGSIYFDGTGDYLSCGALGHNVNSGQNTIEMWIYPTNVSSNEPALFEFYTDDGNNFRLQIYTGGGYSGDLRLLTRSGSGSNNIETAGASVVSANSWQHIACVRNSSNYWDVYVDGTKVITGSFVHSFDTTNVDFRIGKVEYGTDRYFEGYMSDVRIVTGTAVYTSAFTPPTAPLTAITNTSLLLNGTDAGIIDKSQSVKTLALNGDVKSSTTQSKYLTSSMYFDGTGDLVSTAQSANLGTGDFTIEAWVYPTALNGNDTFIAEHWAGVSAGFIFRAHTNNYLSIFDGSTNQASSTAIVTNQWQHVAASRSSGTLKLFIDGTQVLSVSNSTTSLTGNGSGESITVGAIHNGSGSFTNFFNGYISDARVTKGLARYTANFTPPAAALQG